MAIITYPLNNIEYTAEDAELYLATRTSGVFANNDFPITVPGTGNVVTIGEGIGWIRNSKFAGKVVANKTEMSLDMGLPNATYPRIDAIVLQFSANSNATEIIVKNGTAQTNPAPPEVTRTESVYELHLYHVYRPAGAANVTVSNVTDRRMDEDYCGLMRDGVTGIPTDQLQRQVTALLDEIAQELSQINAGAAVMLKATYDPKGRGVDVYDYGPHLYKATLLADSWTSAGSGSYTQTAALTPLDGGPAVTLDSVLTSAVMCEQTTVQSTNEALQEALGIINGGNTVLGVNQLTVTVFEVPEADVEAIWQIKQGVN